jgi:hypothetical protein
MQRHPLLPQPEGRKIIEMVELEPVGHPNFGRHATPSARYLNLKEEK